MGIDLHIKAKVIFTVGKREDKVENNIHPEYKEAWNWQHILKDNKHNKLVGNLYTKNSRLFLTSVIMSATNLVTLERCVIYNHPLTLMRWINPFISFLVLLFVWVSVFTSSNICNHTPPSTSPSPWQLLAGIKSERIWTNEMCCRNGRLLQV